MKIKVLLSIILLALSSCTNHEELFDRSFPIIRTGAITDVTMWEVTFKGEILEFNNNQIIDHGFIHGKNPYLSVIQGNKISFGELTGGKNFTTTITPTAYRGLRLYVKSYVITSDNTIVYGGAMSV